MTHPDRPNEESDSKNQEAFLRPRDSALSAGLLNRVFHQPSLIYFQAVAKHLSIREAARQLNIASSAVTRQIAQLEDALGLALFYREKKRLRLSPAGEILYKHADRLLAPMRAAISELEMLRGIKTGSVRIAAVESVGHSFLPALISSFGKDYPRLSIDIDIASSSDVISMLINEDADIGFGFIAHQPREIELTIRHDVRIGVVMKPDHPLADADRITFADCIAHPIAVARPEISIREVIEPFLERTSSSMPPLVEVNSIRMLVELAMRGHYLSIMTPVGAQNEIESGELVFRPLADKGLPLNRFGILVRSTAALQFAPAVFYEHAADYFRKIRFPGED